MPLNIFWKLLLRSAGLMGRAPIPSAFYVARALGSIRELLTPELWGQCPHNSFVSSRQPTSIKLLLTQHWQKTAARELLRNQLRRAYCGRRFNGLLRLQACHVWRVAGTQHWMPMSKNISIRTPGGARNRIRQNPEFAPWRRCWHLFPLTAVLPEDTGSTLCGTRPPALLWEHLGRPS